MPTSLVSAARSLYGRQSRDERLTHLRVAVLGLKRVLFGVGIFAGWVVASGTAGKRQ